MKKTASLIVLLFAFLFFTACNLFDKKEKKSDDVQLGMLFEKPERLAGIPMGIPPVGGVELPASISLIDGLPPVGNQGNQQSCVAWTVAYALKAYQEKRELKQDILFSPAYIYNQINGGRNVPTYVSDALRILASQGVCTWNEMPYNDSDWVKQPSETAKQNAKRFRIDEWRQVNVQDPRELKAYLATGYPIIFGAQVSRAFVDDGYTKKASYIWTEKGVGIGGHAMLLVGYDDAKKAFQFMNSWGPEWGSNGYGYISYDLWPEVVSYGFIAKDAVTPVQQPETNTDPNKYPDLTKSNPEIQDTLQFRKTDVQHNVIDPDDPLKGNAMKIEGFLDLPPGNGKKLQIVVHVYLTSTNQQVRSLTYPRYSDVNGYSAGFTPEYPIPATTGFRNSKWWLHIPYDAIDLPKGRTDLFAIPTLFIDGFGTAFGERIDFIVTK